MKGSELFKKEIKQYVEGNPIVDINKHENKSIDDCVNYILTQVEKSNCNGFSDDEIYGMAVHYYDEPNESLGEIKNLQPRCVVNHHIDITEEEKAEMKKEALEEIKREQMSKLRKNTQQSPIVHKTETQQLSLF